MKDLQTVPSVKSGILVAGAYGLISGLVMALIFWLVDNMPAAYRGDGDFEIATLLLTVNSNTFVLRTIIIFLATELLTSFFLKSRPTLDARWQLAVRTLVGAALLTTWYVLFFVKMHWYPEFVSRKSALYIMGLGVVALAFTLGYAFYYARKSAAGSGFRALRSAYVLAGLVLISLNGYHFYKKAQARDDQVNLIVIMLDTLRSDHLGCYGYELPTSPALDEFASESLLFTKSYSQSMHTKPTTASFFTSLYPSQHNVIVGNKHDAAGNFYTDVLDTALQTMAEYMTGAGFNSAGFLDQGQLHDYMGFAQGFTFYNSYLSGAPEVNHEFFRWLPSNKHRKFFAYLHYLDVHAPYSPPERYKKQFVKTKSDMYIPDQEYPWRDFMKRFDDIKDQLTKDDIDFLRQSYNAEIRFLDEQLGIVFQRLKDAGVYENSLIIITSDHGESFMEHGELDHGITLYEEVLQVPLIIRFPNAKYKGVIDEPVQTIDVLPTILDHFNIDAQDDLLMGRSLLALVDDTRTFDTRPIFSERSHLISIRKGDHKLIYDRVQDKLELYDLALDPGEKKNVILEPAYAKISKDFKDELITWADNIKSVRPSSQGVKLDKETVEKLKSLGYIR